MGKIEKQFFIILFALICTNIIYMSIAEAIAVAPSRMEILISPGESYQGEFTITNTEDEPIKAIVRPEQGMGVGGKDVSKFLKVSPGEVIIPSKGSKNVKFKVKVAKNVSGEYAPTIVFREEPVNRKPMAYAQIRMPIYLIIKGTEIYKGELASVKVISVKPLIVSILVRNDGNVHTRPAGALRIKKIIKLSSGPGEGESGAESTLVATININERGGPVFGAGGVGDIGGKFKEVNLDSGNYIAELDLEFSPGIMFNKKVNFEVNDKNEVKMLE